MTRPNCSDQVPFFPISGFGIDTIGLSFSIPRRSLQALPERRVRTSLNEYTGELGEDLVGGYLDFNLRGAPVKAFATTWGGVPRVRVEFSAAKVAQAHNITPLPISSVQATMEEVTSALRREIPATPSLAAMTLSRLDLTRDFVHLDAPCGTLASIAAATPRTNTPRRRYEHNRAGELSYMLMGSNGRWKVRMYDKEGEVLDRNPRSQRHKSVTREMSDAHGRLRFELELRGKLLKERGAASPSDVPGADVQLFELARHYFNWCRLGETYAGASRVRQVLADSPTVTAAEKRNMLATLAADHVGMPPPCGKNQAATARRLLRRHGLGATSLMGDGAARRLDFDGGREVPA